MMLFPRVTLCLVFAAVVPGCSPGPKMNYAAANLVKARGTVTLDGKPLSGVMVTFESPEDSTNSNGLTDGNGRYQLQFDSNMAGVTRGEKIVRISSTKKVLGVNASEDGGGGEDGKAKSFEKPKELVPDKYNKKSELKVDVKAGQTVYNFDLKSP